MSEIFQGGWRRLKKLPADHRPLPTWLLKTAMAFTSVINIPYLLAQHTPVFWRYDLDPQTNPYFIERFGINAVFNAGAIKIQWQIFAGGSCGRA